MAKQSAGILLYRKRNKRLEVFLIHPGGPFWRNKDNGAWSIPKGQHGEGEEPLEAAKREFKEETGYRPPPTDYRSIGEAKLKSGKIIRAWVVEGDIDETKIQSATFEVEWPPRSGRKKSYPEADRAGWFSLAEARQKLHPAQRIFIDALERL